jgi:hypothetical protein
MLLCMPSLFYARHRPILSKGTTRHDTTHTTKLVAKRGSGELDVYPDLMQLSSDVISRAAFGSNYEEGQKVFELLKEQTDLGLLMLQSVYIPGMR